MLLTELKDDISGQFGKELDHVFKQQIESKIISAYSEVKRQYVDKYNVIPQSFISQINCEPTEEADVAECCSVTLDCQVTKTVNKIPESIRIRGSVNSLTYVGTIDGKQPFGFINPEELAGILKERFKPKGIFYTVINNKIYLFNGTVKNIRIRGMFGDIREIAKLNDCENSPEGCGETLTIPDDTVEQIKSFVYNELRGTKIIDKKEEIVLNENEES